MTTEDGASPERLRTMHYWLATTLRETREAAPAKPTAKDIAALARVDPSTISNFETLKSWPRSIDRIVAAYAAMCGIEDGRDLWKVAVQRHRKHGGAPTLGDLSDAQRALLHALDAAQRQAPYADESRDMPTSIRRRQGGS